MTDDPRILTRERIDAIAEIDLRIMRMVPIGAAITINALLGHIDALSDQAALDRATISAATQALADKSREVDALTSRMIELLQESQIDRSIVEIAEKLVDAKRRAVLAFGPGAGLRGIAMKTEGSASHRRLAKQVADYGNELERAIDDRNERRKTTS